MAPGPPWPRGPRMKSSLRVIVAVIGLFAMSGAAAEPLRFRLCSENLPFLPLTNTDPATPGDAQILLDMAAAATGTQIEHVTASWSDCQQMLDLGNVDALNAAGHAAINIAIAEFPQREGRVDSTRSLGALRTDLFRRVGSPVQVRDGALVGLKTRVGILHAYQVNSLSVARLGGTVDDNSRTITSLAKRLVSGQLDLVAGTDELRRLCAGLFANRIEQLPQPLDEAHYYLAFGKAYFAAHRDAIERLWDKLGQIRNSADYRVRVVAARSVRDAAAGASDCPLADTGDSGAATVNARE